MATIGLDKLYYAPITLDNDGKETYGTPVQLAKAISAELSVEANEAIQYGDDGIAESVKEFKSGSLSLNIVDLKASAVAALLGAEVDENGVLISRGEDNANYVAIGYRARRSNGKYNYFWLYRVQFSIPGTSLATKGDSITFSTPTIEGTIFQRVKPDGKGKHPWRAEVEEDGTNSTVINAWYTAVYEPTYTTPVVSGGGNV